MGLVSFAAGLALVATGLLSTEFLPDADPGQLVLTIEMPAGTTLEVTDAAARRVEEQILAWPEANMVFSSVGVGGAGLFAPREARFARIDVRLVDRGERRRTAGQLAKTGRLLGSGLPGATVTAAVQSFVPGTGARIQFRVEGDQPAVLGSLADEMAEIVRNVPGTADVRNGGVAGQPELVMHVDRERAADVGLTPLFVASVLRTALAAPTVSTFQPEGTTGWDLTVGLSSRERVAIEQVAQIPIVTPNGASVRVGQIAQLSQASGPTAINRLDHRRFVVVTADLSDRPLGDVVKDIHADLSRLQVPAGYRISEGGRVGTSHRHFSRSSRRWR